MRIEHFNTEPMFEIPYRGIDADGIIRDHTYPVLECRASGIPDGIKAIVCTSDLQGLYYSDNNKKGILAGIHVAEELAIFLEVERGINPKETLVILAGDFFCEPNLGGRGGFGYVDEVWYAFADRFGQVVGVAGNHDDFKDNFPSNSSNISLILNGTITVEGLTIAGISGIIGNSKKRPYRYSEQEFYSMTSDITQHLPDIIVLHQNPDEFDREWKQFLSLKINDCKQLLCVCGHRKRNIAFSELPNGLQLLNVHEKEKVAILSNILRSH